MKYIAAFLSLAIGALAIPQEASSVTNAPATTSAPSNLTPQQSCAIACPSDDLNCRAACVGVARPNASQAVETNECAARCDQGDGSPEETQIFSDCVQSCINSLFPSSQTDAFGNTVAGSAAATTSAATGSVTNTASDASSTAQSTGAANSNSAHFAGAGLAGLLAAFAL